MPTETTIAARRSDGAEMFYHDSPYPPLQIVDFFERKRCGATGEFLDMVKEEQKIDLYIRERNSRLEFVTRILGMVFAFILSVCIIICGALLIHTGSEVTGCITLLSGLVAVIGCLATGGKKFTPTTSS